MNEKQDEKSDPASEEVELVITQDDYEAGLERLEAYRTMGRANELIRGAIASVGPGSTDARNEALRALQETPSAITKARDSLLQFLSSDS